MVALRTAEQMKSNLADQVFYELGDRLRDRGEQRRVRELCVSHDRPQLALFTKAGWVDSWARQ